MKKAMVLCASLVISAGVLAGCGSGLNEDVSTVKVEKKGKITSLTVESFEKDYYSKEDLESFITEQVESYAAENTDSKVEVKNVSVDDQTAKLTVGYENSEEYSSFNETEFFVGTVVQAMAKGYDFDVDFYEASDAAAENEEKDAKTESETSDTTTENKTGNSAASKNTVNADDIINENDYKTVITDERINVKVDGEILYVSDATADLVSKDTISLPVDETRAEGTGKTLVYIIYK